MLPGEVLIQCQKKSVAINQKIFTPKYLKKKIPSDTLMDLVNHHSWLQGSI